MCKSIDLNNGTCKPEIGLPGWSSSVQTVGEKGGRKAGKATGASRLGSVPALHYRKQEGTPQRSRNRLTACVLPQDPRWDLGLSG